MLTSNEVSQLVILGTDHMDGPVEALSEYMAQERTA